ncbi:MAG TPA: hypothetical protein VFZ59_06695 [Verrucomicrobiae bacterium]|nr:hypothetical protein [Verrucomicrobiae bacterium]
MISAAQKFLTDWVRGPGRFAVGTTEAQEGRQPERIYQLPAAPG